MRTTWLLIVPALAAVGCKGPVDPLDRAGEVAVCEDVLGRIEISTVLDKRKEVRVRSFFQSLDADGHSARERELIADLAGVANPPLVEFRRTTPASELPSPRAGLTAIPFDDRVLEIRALIAEGRLRELAALATEDPTLALSQVSGQSLAVLSILQPSDASADDLGLLLAAGFEFGLHELASAIAHNVPRATFELLLDNSDADLAESWTDRHNNRPMDLAGLAAAKSRLDLLDALLRREPDPKASRAMDYLPVPADPGDATATEAILKRLAAAGYRPTLPSTAERLRTWVANATFDSLPLDTPIAGLTPEVRAVGDRFQDEAHRLDTELAAAREQESQCQREGLDESANPGSLLAKRGASGGFSYPNIGPGATEIAAVFKRQLSDREAAEAAQLLALTSHVSWPHAPGRWNEFVEFVEDIPEGTNPRILSTATRLALGLAPYEVLAETLALTGGLPANAVVNLASRVGDDTVDVFNKLAEQGLDLHYVDSQGMNAIGAVARTMVSLETLDHLLDNGVAVQPDAPGFDALDYVLLNLITLPEFRTSASALPWIQKLMDHGTSVEASHRQLMELLRLDRPDTHADIVRTVPELAQRT
ncbi:MAG: hypothetical protein J4F45_07145 [Pseudomonadales bacterium]|nr:hypothetical protein [Pseudomonadales bacterium]